LYARDTFLHHHHQHPFHQPFFYIIQQQQQQQWNAEESGHEIKSDIFSIDLLLFCLMKFATGKRGDK
jgi:hypothetical protein